MITNAYFPGRPRLLDACEIAYYNASDNDTRTTCVNGCVDEHATHWGKAYTVSKDGGAAVANRCCKCGTLQPSDADRLAAWQAALAELKG